MRPAVLWTAADWADAVAALPATGPLPVRTVLVPRERHAHVLRRALLAGGRREVLAGTRFAGASVLAAEALRAAGVDFEPGEDGLRPARLLALFEEDLPLEHFGLPLLRRTRGWHQAFARAIGDLEGAGLAPDRLPSTTPHWRDLALLWRRLDAAAGRRWTRARILGEAAALLEEEAAAPAGRPDPGPVLAVAGGDESAVHARFLRALPGATLALLGARPVRDAHLRRVEALYGGEAREALSSAEPPRKSGRELDLLAGFLFAPPEELADPARPRSRGPDGTVHLEEHPGLEAEIEAAADWVGRQVLAGTPLEDIALLLPETDPLAGLLAERLARLPWRDGPFPVHVAGGLPATSLAGGARALALVRALSSHLSAGALAALLPALRAPVDDRQHLSHGEAVELAWSLGTVGGNAANPAGALEWAPRAAARREELAAALARARREKDSESREASRHQRALDRLRAVGPALEALVAVARRVVEGAPLAALTGDLGAFMKEWLLEPGGSARVSALLSESLEALREDAVGASLRGREALEVVEERLLSLRVPSGRFGEPAVYLGSISGAAGLDFAAVRLLGLGEGSLPPAAREDPVLPDSMRLELEPASVPASADRVLWELHAFHRVVRGARSWLILSAPRSDLERTEREPSSVFVEAGAALARPDAATGEPADPVPDLGALRRDAFLPARRDLAAFRAGHPLSRAAWLDRAAQTAEIPPAWTGAEHLDLERAAELERPRAGLERPAGSPAAGATGEGPFPALPGLSAERPISASALADLLACPRHFLYRRVLHWDEPPGPPPLGELDPLSYGGLFHRVMEGFYRAHGKEFVAGERTLAAWQEVADRMAAARFQEFLSEYPLVGEGLRDKELRRLEDDVRSFLAYDWEGRTGRSFVDVERPFGEDRPVELEAGGRRLFVRGYIDRLDVEGDHTLVRDLKTGRPHPRQGAEAGPTPERDVQLALYGLVTRRLARSWGLPQEVQAAYAYAGDRGHSERAFREDFAELARAGTEWLALAAGILAERAFVPTPEARDCAYCFFRPLCGEEVPARAREALRGEGGVLGAFRDLKAGEETG